MSNIVNPQMFVLARESRGMTQGELAKELGITQGKVSKYESGMLGVSPEQLADIAKALEYPVNFFSQADPVPGAGSSCLHHRKRQSMPVSDLKRIHAKINVVRMHMKRLLRGAEIENETMFPRMDVDAYSGGPEEIARLVRKTWNLPAGPVQHLVDAIEAAGGVIFLWPFGTRKLDAISQWVAGLPPLFFVNSESPTDRMRFSLAHEVGHLIMHIQPTPNQEEEADRFASEFLMPAKEIRPYFKPISIAKAAAMKSHWKVSMAAIIKRAFDLGVIRESYYRKLFTQMSKLGYRTSEPAPLEPEEPTILRDIVQVHLSNHKFSVAEMCKLVMLLEHEFRSHYLPEQQKLRLVN